MADGFSRYEIYTTTGSIYCYTGTNVLRNRFGIRDVDQLKQLEADISAIRQNDLLSKPISGRFTSSHLCRIHRYLFGDLYAFAGHFRREDIMKGTTRFLGHQNIKRQLEKNLNELHAENCLQGIPFDQLVERSAYYFAELNFIHPFREGNGRSTREFMRLLFCRVVILWTGQQCPFKNYLMQWSCLFMTHRHCRVFCGIVYKMLCRMHSENGVHSHFNSCSTSHTSLTR